MIKILLLALSLKLGTLAAQTPPTKFTYELLQDTRSRQVLPVYSKEERLLVVSQAKIIMGDIFVHRDLKMEHFGKEVDPLPMLLKLEAEIDSIKDDTEFHTKMMNIFFRQKDLHTTYHFPQPYACYSSLLPFSFKEVRTAGGDKVIAVSTLVDKEDILKVLPTPVSARVGDVVVSYNGLPVEQFVKSFDLRSMGANPDAVRRRSVNLLTFISHKLSFIPQKNTVELTLKNRQGKLYSTSVPWITRINQDCLNPAPVTTNVGKTEGETGANEYQNEFNFVYRNRNSILDTDLKDTAEPTLKYKFVDNEHGRFAYLKLESFIPEKLSVEGVITEVKNLMLTQFVGTDGLIFDLRSNGGGYIALAEYMVQLFTGQDITPLNFVIKASEANLHHLTVTSPTNQFTLAIKEAMAMGQTYGKPLPLNSSKLSTFSTTSLGQFYFKPVALLTDASCYSSCDMFSAQMQDHGGAIIFGEDTTTGAGGANNTNMTNILTYLPEGEWGIFKKLPYKQDLGFSYRQSVRVGLRSGVLLEDTGVISDAVAESTLADLYSNSSEQMKLISARLAAESSQAVSSVRLNGGKTDAVSTGLPGFFAKWEGTDQIQLRQDGKILITLDVEDNNSQGRFLELPKDLPLKLFPEIFELIGLRNEKRVWRKVHSIRIVPEPIALIAGQEISYDFSTEAPFTSLNSKGWNIRDGALHVGQAPAYGADLAAETSLFVAIPEKNYDLSFDSTLLSEEKYDFFKVLLVSENKEKVIVESQSGHLPTKNILVNLKEYAGKTVEIRFVFTSDGATEDVGPKIDNFKIVPVP